jgi:putative ABC transport system permease protein
MIPLISQILDYQSAMQWQQGFDVRCFAIAFFSITLPLLVIICASAFKVQKITILAALRRGLSDHSFRKTYFPLDTSLGPVSWFVSLKHLAHHKRESVLAIVLVAALSSVLVLEIAAFENLRTNSQALTNMLFGELPDVRIFANSSEEAEEISNFVEKDSYARKYFYSQDVEVMIGNYRVNNNVTKDFGLFEGALPYEGRYPRSDDEICVNGVLAGSLGLKVGSAVKVTQGSKTSEYIVVGLIQTVQSNGLTAAMTTEGYQVINPSFMPTEISVYLSDANETANFIKAIDSNFAGMMSAVLNYKMAMHIQLVNYSDIFVWAAFLLIIVTSLLMLLLTYALLRTVIVRRRRELAIQKSLGFTTFNLMNQIALSIIPIAVVGFALGETVGALLFNPIFVMLAGSLGIVSVSLTTPIGLTIGSFVLVLAVFYGYALLIAWRIRKFSADTIITE